MKLADMILDGKHRPAYTGPVHPGLQYSPLEADYLSTKELRSTLRQCPVVLADNIVDYFIENQKKFPDSVEEFVKSIPNLAPPFEEFWMESRFSWMTLLSQNGQAPGGGFGAFFRGFDCERGDHTQSELGERWILEGSLYLRLDEVVGPICSTAIYLTSEGEVLCFKEAHHPTRNVDQIPSMMSMMCSLWLAIGFMHCKNVTMREECVPDKLRKAKAKRGRPPGLVKWNVLDVEPMKQVLRSYGKSESTGLKQALHICRGHFKDYRQSGLFGKTKGVFWWDSTARGSSAHGVVVKDYNVKAPRIVEDGT